MEIKVGEEYRHFKGDTVKVLNIAIHSETLEQLVIYEHKNKIWARPINMFLSKVDKEKYPDILQEYRFEKVNE